MGEPVDALGWNARRRHRLQAVHVGRWLVQLQRGALLSSTSVDAVPQRVVAPDV